MDRAEFIVAGGGIAGLAAAIAAAPRETLLLEQAPEWQEAGAGLQLGPNAVRALQKLGAWDAVAPITYAPPAIIFRDGMSGRVLKRLPLGKAFEQRFGNPYRVAHRADLHGALRQIAQALPHLSIKLGQPVSLVEEQANGMVLHAASISFQGNALLAADGVKSTIRQRLFPGTEARTTGETFHRALLPPETMAMVPDGDAVNLWLYPNGHVVHYPAGRSGKLNLVVITPATATPARFFAAGCKSLQDVLHAPKQWSEWPALYVNPMPTTTRGRTLLLGDAAHGTVPYLAQGSAMALEDAATLRTTLNNGHDVVSAFAIVDGLRTPRTARLHQASMKQGRIDHASGWLRFALHSAMRLMTNHAAFSRMQWIYNG